ncbi:MAG: CoB--CoM heterodisulfide reductase iron-sulfur subunit A family protein [Caldisericia bacterium]|nr:CoB--CoM heterodisulfide reductase iron-sulfur subunit A family protein [Caldisericia bacterium]
MSVKKIGVYICECGGNISDFVDTERLRIEIAKEKDVDSSMVNMFTCSDAGQQKVIEDIKEKHLDGIVVASCSPKLHLGTFRAMAKRAGLNEYQYTQVNLREQCSWAHTHDMQKATKKGLRLIRAGIAKTLNSKPLKKLRVKTLPHVLVIGAGMAGMRAALSLSDIGISVHVIEKEPEVGGMTKRWGKMFPRNKNGYELVEKLETELKKRDNIELLTNAELVEKDGHIGDFSVKIQVKKDHFFSLKVGCIIVSTGFETYTPTKGEFGYGLPGIVTLPEFEELLAQTDDGSKMISYNKKQIKSICYIYCVGSRQNKMMGESAHQYCSRYCCSATVNTSNQVHEIDQTINQFHLYRDIRTYGKYELLYTKSLEEGSLYFRYDEEYPPSVSFENNTCTVVVKDSLTGNQNIKMNCDLVVLVTGMIPRTNKQLANVLKIPIGQDGFFNEIHPKLRPVETVVDGVFIAGSCQGPKNLSESVASSMAAVAKSAALLLKGYVNLEPLVAEVDPNLCEWCGECLKACPYNAIQITEIENKKIAEVVPILCKGGGVCVPACPSQAISVKGYTNTQISSMIESLAKNVDIIDEETNEEKKTS